MRKSNDIKGHHPKVKRKLVQIIPMKAEGKQQGKTHERTDTEQRHGNPRTEQTPWRNKVLKTEKWPALETWRKHLASFGLCGCCLSISIHRSLGPGLATRFVTLLFPAAYLRCSLRSPPIWTAGRIWLHPAIASAPWASKMPRDVWIWLTSRPCGLQHATALQLLQMSEADH